MPKKGICKDTNAYYKALSPAALLRLDALLHQLAGARAAKDWVKVHELIGELYTESIILRLGRDLK